MENRKELEAYTIGDLDDKAARISRIYIKNSNHIIYEINDSGDIGMMMRNPGGYNWNAISAYTARISTLLRSPREKKVFLSNLAKAYHDFFSGNSASAAALFQAIEADIIRQKVVIWKLNYLITALLVVLFSGMFVLATEILEVIPWPDKLHELSRVAAFGSFGGFLSISFRINLLEPDLEAGNLLPRITAVSRIFLAILSSFTVLVVIRSNLVFGVVNDAGNPFIWYTLAVLSGFSESFIPNILNQIENLEQGDQSSEKDC